MTRQTALITGGSRGLGFALAAALAARGWALILDGRDPVALEAARAALAQQAADPDAITAIPGDVSDAAHRGQLAAAVRERGGLDLLVNNASTLGRSPLPPLVVFPLDILEAVYRTNVIAPLALFQAVYPYLRRSARILNITSDAAVEAYAGWGGYGSSKAALEQLSAILAVEHPDLKIYWVDPGDMRTQMHQDAFPGEDIGDRPLPQASVPGLLRLIDEELPSGRYQARELATLAESISTESISTESVSTESVSTGEVV